MLLSSLVAAALLTAEPTVPSPPPTVASVPALTYPTWSLGAGLYLFAEQLTAVGGGLGVLAAPSVTPSVSLERAFSQTFALGLGLQGSYSATESGMAVAPTGTIGFSVSPRFVLTAPEAPVSFTFFSTVTLGYATAASNFNVTGAGGQVSALTGSVSGGGALELKLLERLALRVQASFIRFSIARTVVKLSATGTEANATVTGLSLIPSPGLELRLYL